MSDRRVALVTGAASGIGRATAFALAQDGVSIAVGDLNDSRAQAVAEQIRKEFGVEARAYGLDVTSRLAVDGAVEQLVSDLGRLDVLVNNAGFTRQGPSQGLADEDWNAVIEVHLTGAFNCARAAFQHLAQSPHGCIVGLSSIAATLGLGGRLSYCTAKAGIDGMTRSLAVEWACDGIRVNAVAPGWTQTELVADSVRRGVVDEAELCSVIPLARLAEPHEIAAAIAFLASPAASYVTGQTLIVDGGVTAGRPV